MADRGERGRCSRARVFASAGLRGTASAGRPLLPPGTRGTHAATHGLGNEVYLRLINQQEVSWQNRAQFFGIAAQMMRRILVSHARGREAQKRGGAAQHITLEEEVAAAPERDLNLLALDDALTRLENGRSGQKPNGGAPFFYRLIGGGDGRSDGRVAADGRPAMADGEGVVAPGD